MAANHGKATALMRRVYGTGTNDTNILLRILGCVSSPWIGTFYMLFGITRLTAGIASMAASYPIRRIYRLWLVLMGHLEEEEDHNPQAALDKMKELRNHMVRCMYGNCVADIRSGVFLAVYPAMAPFWWHHRRKKKKKAKKSLNKKGTKRLKKIMESHCPEKKPEGRGECVACQERRACIIFQECWHLCLCQSCADKYKDARCPVCRQKSKRQKIFLV